MSNNTYRLVSSRIHEMLVSIEEMRRKIFNEVALYEHSASGCLDHFIMHAVYGDFDLCIANAVNHDRKQVAYLKQWADRYRQLVEGSQGVVAVKIRHFWHRDTVNRRYFRRIHDIADLGFNLWIGLVMQPDKPLALLA
jgi:hypothetical protein